MQMLVDFTKYDKLVLDNDATMNMDEYIKKYDKYTTCYYKAHRFKKTDPIDDTQLSYYTGFAYKYIWDPYTGDIVKHNGIKVEDPFGPLYFSPSNIVQNIFYKRLMNLWESPIYDETGTYEGYYGDNVGAGNMFELHGRGSHAERYLFRLPIVDCYLPENHDLNIVTMGPILDDDDIDVIDGLMKKETLHIYSQIGSLKRLKKIYDVAISSNPLEYGCTYLNNLGIYWQKNAPNANEQINRAAVDLLRYM